jgi:hypothetical protein
MLLIFGCIHSYSIQRQNRRRQPIDSTPERKISRRLRIAAPRRGTEQAEQKDGSGKQISERIIAMTTTLNLASIKPSLDKLQAIERELAASLIERDEVIRASLVALLARQHLVVLGPPGTGKSARPMTRSMPSAEAMTPISDLRTARAGEIRSRQKRNSS